MPKREYRWVPANPLDQQRKAEITSACECLITEILKPRYLHEVRPADRNYPVDIRGRWRGRAYSFLVRFRSGYQENAGEEYDSPLRPSRPS
jgi:hypothetical protein